MKLLITGGTGQVASSLVKKLAESEFNWTEFDWTAPGHSQLDICNDWDVKTCIAAEKPDLLINCAGFTQVDRAEQEQEKAFAVNQTGASHLAKACRDKNIPLIHLSTDYIFDGQTQKPYPVFAKANPLSVYGASKWAGEQAVWQTCPQSVIIRTSWVFAEQGNNFLLTMARLLQSKTELNVVSDQIGCPTYAGDLADLIIAIARQIQQQKIRYGIYHYCGDQPTSWFDFAAFIAKELAKSKTINCTLKPISSNDYPAAAKRPHYSVLDCPDTLNQFDCTLSNWQKAVQTCLRV